MSITRFLLVCLAILAVGWSAEAHAHGGGIDTYGGHRNRKTGSYHFHQGPLAGQSFSSKEEALAALSGPAPKMPIASLAGSTVERKLNRLIALLIRKGLITEAELASSVEEIEAGTPRPETPGVMGATPDAFENGDTQPERSQPSSSSLNPTPSGGSVHVRGYYRKDGTYVKPHSRKRPRR